MLSYPLDQEHLLWLLDELYIKNLPCKVILEAMAPMDKIFKNARTLKVDALDAERFIKQNPSTKEITNPVVFQHGNVPTEDGLLSEVIFGITQEERSNIYGYIDLDERFINPFFYNIWLRLDRYLRPCVYETEKFIINKDGYLEPNKDGETGIAFLYKNRDKLQFKNTRMKDQLNALLHAKETNNLFTTKCIVIPPFYRDVDTRKGGRIGIGEINQLYKFLITAVKALRETRMLGLDLLGASRGKIQDTLLHIHNWFTIGETRTGEIHAGAGIFKKMGVLRRTLLAKTTDYSSRLVLSAPIINVDSREDLMCDMDHASIPLASAITIAYPFMSFHLNRWANNNLNSNVIDTDGLHITNKQELANLPNTERLRDVMIEFSSDRFDKELKEYIRGYSNRFRPIYVTLAKNGKKVPLKFKGYNITAKEYAAGKREDTTRLIERDFTWLDLFYLCACESTEGRVAIITRYPMDSYFNHIYLRINIATTKKTKPMVINGKFYRWYPDFTQEDIGKDTSNLFVDTLSFSNAYCPAAGADYDGDTASVKMIFSDEANAELNAYIDSKAQFINLQASNCRVPDEEGIQALYSLTLVLPDDKDRLTKTKDIEFE